ncbi:MAG: AMP-binding protein [Proteobacteria bacterium]|nr:AMP-binding protein [Pseudomonadota bacterium]
MSDWFEKRTFGQLPSDAAARFGDREALVFKDRRWTWREFSAEVDRAAKALIALGVEPGEKIALWMNNKPEWLFLMYAVAKVGAVLVPLNTRYRTEDIQYAVTQSNTGTIISDDRSGPVDYLGMLREVLPNTDNGDPSAHQLDGFPDLRRIVFVGKNKLPGTLTWDEAMARCAEVSDELLRRRAAAVDPDGLALIGYTSGTTGNPKGVMHTHINIRNAMERAAILGISFTDTEINYLPMFHLYGLGEVALICVVTGAKQILMEAFEAEEALRLIESEKVTIAHGFDTHWKDLLDRQASAPRDVSSLRLGTLPSGTDATIPTALRVQDVFCPTVSGFGMTEIWAYVSVSFPSDTPEQRIYASGMPMNGVEFRIGDPQSAAALPLGEVGQLMVKGYTVMKGYYEKPEATVDSFTSDGWFLTGDMAKLREDGRFVFLGRYKDMLKVGGENVSPAEIEARLMVLHGVSAVAIVSYPDPRLHEVAVAYVIRSANSEINEDDILNALRGNVASFKIPRHVLFVDEFPMTPSGKVQKVKLRASAIEALGDPGVAQAS